MDEFKERLKRLKEQRKLASHANFREVLEENERAKKPANWDKKLERNLKRLEAEEARAKAEAAGRDYELDKSLEYRADEIERWHKLKGKTGGGEGGGGGGGGGKRAKEEGLVDFEEASKRQYGRSVKQLRPDLEEYEALKREMGEDKFYLRAAAAESSGVDAEPSGSKTTTTATTTTRTLPAASLTKDSKAGIDRMVEDVHKQIDIRSKRSRRRKFDEDADVDYINERNMKFNKKLERFYGDYTGEIKKNFERGTAM